MIMGHDSKSIAASAVALSFEACLAPQAREHPAAPARDGVRHGLPPRAARRQQGLEPGAAAYRTSSR